MPKKLKYLVFLINILLITSISIYFIFKNKNKIKDKNGVLNLVPDNYVCIMKINKINNLNKIFNTDSLFNNFLKLYNLHNFKYALRKFLDNNQILNIKETSYFSFHPKDKENISIVAYLPVNINFTNNKISKIFDNYNISVKIYDKNKFYELYDLTNNIIIYLYSFADYVALSNDKLIIEGIIRNKNSSIKKNYYDLFKISKSKSSEANILVNFDNFYFLAHKIINNNYIKKILSSKNLAKYGVLDLNINNNLLILNGFLIKEKDDNNLISIFNEKIAFKETQLNLIPYNVDQFIHFNFNDINDFYNKLNNFKKKVFIERFKNFKKEIKEKYSYNVEDDFIKNIYNEITFFFVRKTPYLLLKMNNFDEFKYKFLNFVEKTNKNHFFKSLKVNETIYNIYELVLNDFIANIFGEFFNTFSELYFTFYNDNIIFSDSYESLNEYLLNVSKNNLFNTLPANQKIKKLISSNNNFIYFANFGQSKTINKYLIKQSKEEDRFFCVILKNEDEKMLLSVLTGISDQSDIPQIVWKLKIDAPIKAEPQIVKNHNNGEDEIFLQDEENNLYLINQSGNIIWKKRIDEHVLSKFFQVDFYKNNKLQLLFNTYNYIHLIDRNGNYVENFPVKLPAKATNGLNVFDYDNNKDYRIFIACSDKKVYAYNIKGKYVEGWKIPITKDFVYNEIQHFRINTKDYICVKDSSNMYVFDRRGNSRFNFKENIIFSDNKFYLYSNDFVHLVFTDINGRIYNINFEKGYKFLDLDKFSPYHIFMVNNFNCDKTNDYIFVDENRLIVYDKENKIFDKDFEFKIDYMPKFFDLNNFNTKIIGIKLINGDLYIFDCKGNVLKGFPIKDCEKFTFCKFNKEEKYFNLIICKNDNFLYNYIIKF